MSVCYVLGPFFFFKEKKIVSGEFSDSPRVRISHFHYWDPGSIPDWGTKVLQAIQYAPPPKKIMFLLSLLPLGSSDPSGRFNYNYRTMPYYRAPNKTRMLIVKPPLTKANETGTVINPI